MNRKWFAITLLVLGAIFLLDKSLLSILGIILLMLGGSEFRSYTKHRKNGSELVNVPMKTVFITVGAILLVIVLLVVRESSLQTYEPEPQVQDVVAGHPPTREELLQLVNEERAKVGVEPLVVNPMLEESAQWKADDMAVYNYFGHENHDGTRGVDIIPNFAGEICIVGSENLVDNIYTNTAEGSLQAWKTSQSHYDAMVNPNYTLTGFGINGTKIVEHFCQTR